ncbi:MAG: LexA family transcriptional regulator [Gammaproteobacteria bacterium]|nr:LexA family transcriptional regulator [Gammaproteobacteria bacterium]
MEARDFEKIVRKRLAETGETPIGAARRAGLPRDAIRSVLRGHPPNLLRAKKICDALGLDLNVGSPHESATRGQVHPRDIGGLTRTVSQELERHTQGLVRVVAAAGGDPIPPEMRAGLGNGPRDRGDPRKTPVNQTVETETAAVVVPFAASIRFTAESDEPVWEETAEMAVSVARSALASWARPERLRCARVVDDSMAPAIRDGDLVVLDAGRAEPLDGQVFVVLTGEGVLVKRLRRTDDRWELESDNPAYESRAVTDRDRILGQVAWAGPPSAGHKTQSARGAASSGRST